MSTPRILNITFIFIFSLLKECWGVGGKVFYVKTDEKNMSEYKQNIKKATLQD